MWIRYFIYRLHATDKKKIKYIIPNRDVFTSDIIYMVFTEEFFDSYIDLLVNILKKIKKYNMVLKIF